jgi:hypothetical protein
MPAHASQRDRGRLRSDHVVQAPERGIGEAMPREETTLRFPPIPPSPPPAERGIVLRLQQGFVCMLTLAES